MFLRKVNEAWNYGIRENRVEKVKEDLEALSVGYFKKTRR